MTVVVVVVGGSNEGFSADNDRAFGAVLTCLTGDLDFSFEIDFFFSTTLFSGDGELRELDELLVEEDEDDVDEVE